VVWSRSTRICQELFLKARLRILNELSKDVYVKGATAAGLAAAGADVFAFGRLEVRRAPGIGASTGAGQRERKRMSRCTCTVRRRREALSLIL